MMRRSLACLFTLLRPLSSPGGEVVAGMSRFYGVIAGLFLVGVILGLWGVLLGERSKRSILALCLNILGFAIILGGSLLL